MKPITPAKLKKLEDDIRYEISNEETFEKIIDGVMSKIRETFKGFILPSLESDSDEEIDWKIEESNEWKRVKNLKDQNKD
jgi:hypothetical protein